MDKKLKMTLKTVLLIIIGLTLSIQPSHIGADVSKKAKASVVLKAMEEELDRSIKNLGKDGTPPPYFLRYRVTENKVLSITAMNGALGYSNESHTRLLDIEVRVGDHRLDNTHPIRGSRGDYGSGYSQPVFISLDDDPESIKSSIWLETDKGYKAAVERLIQIKANQNVNVTEEDRSDDFSTEVSHRDIGEPADISADIPKWEKKIKEYSALLTIYPGIYSSQVFLRAEAENKYFVNSEGASLLQGRVHWRLTIIAQTKADDGMELEKAKAFDARTPGNLPDDETVKSAIKELSGELLALRKAPLMDPYTGPAILSGRASAVFFHEIFGHRIEGHRQKDENEGQTFAKQINKEILPPLISVYDDPTQEKYNEIDLNGHYLYDDEGVKAQRVDLVKDGILKNFLMSRSPINDFPKSNGHGRAQAGLAPVGRQGNFVVEATKTVTTGQLRQSLIEECKKQGKPYGLLFDDISGGSTHTMRFSAQAFDVVPIMVYRVYVDGRPDELVRGVNLIGTPLTSFSKIIACGGEVGIFNGYCGAESGTIPVSAISPAILTEQIEVQKRYKETDKPPVLPPPQGIGPAQAAYEKNKEKSDILLNAMNDEMTRSMESLKIENMEKPYYLEYTVWDRYQMAIEGSFGAMVSSDKNRQRLLKVDLRVGDYQSDNSGFVESSGIYSSMLGNADNIVVDDNYNVIRRNIWLTTDNAYKQAVEQLAAKRAYIKNQAQPEEIPDFSRSQSVKAIAPRQTIKIEREKWENLIRNLSAVFRGYPEIYDSSVGMEVTLDHKYYVNNEGAQYRQPQLSVSIVAIATTQAPDGMRLTHYVPFFTTTVGALPNELELTNKIKKMADELTELRSAPVLESYIGPVLFTQQASGELFAQILAPNFSGQRPPLTDLAQMPDLSSSSKLIRRMNRRVLPQNISVIDDPTQIEYNKTNLIGAYTIDDEGVSARSVTLIDKGILKTLLMSRRPRKEIQDSNGHGRAPFVGNPGVQVGNLFITAEGGKPYTQLKNELTQMLKEQKLPFGLIIKTLDNPSITGMTLSMSASTLNSMQTDGQVTAPILIYRVDSETGKEELARGLVISEIGVKDLKYIAGVGNDYYVNNRLLPPGGGIMDSVYLFQAQTNMGIPASIIAPSVLFEEIEFKKNGDNRKKLPILPHPGGNK